MIADQNFYDICFTFFNPTASATVYGRRPKFFRAEHSATAEGENWAYGPTLHDILRQQKNWIGGSRKWPVLLTFSTVSVLT